MYDDAQEEMDKEWKNHQSFLRGFEQPMKMLDEIIAEAESELDSAKRDTLPQTFNYDVKEWARRLKTLKKLKKQFLSALKG